MTKSNHSSSHQHAYSKLMAVGLMLVLGSCTTGNDGEAADPTPTSAESTAEESSTTMLDDPVPATSIAQLDDRFESVTVSLEDRDWIVVRFIDPGSEEMEILAAEVGGILDRDEQTGCYGLTPDPGEPFRPAIWPPGSSLSPGGALTVPGFEEIPLGRTLLGGGGETPLPAAVAEVCDSEQGYEIGQLLDLP